MNFSTTFRIFRLAMMVLLGLWLGASLSGSVLSGSVLSESIAQARSLDTNAALQQAAGTSPRILAAADRVALDSAYSWHNAANLNTKDLAWGDVDNDGDLDLAMLTSTPNPFKLYLNVDGDLQTDPAWTASPPAQAFQCGSRSTVSMAWGDVDNDHDLDLAIGCPDYNLIYRNTANRLETTPAWIAPVSRDTRSIAWGDADNDGDLDLAVGNWEAPNQLYLNQSQGGVITMTLSTAWNPATNNTNCLAWGDMDNDGDLDLAVGNGENSNYVAEWRDNQLYRNNGSGLLTLVAPFSSYNDLGNNGYGMAWADVNEDNYLDLVIYNNDSNNANGRISYVLNAVNGYMYNAALRIFVSGPVSGVAFGDVDNDDDLDLGVSTNMGSNSHSYVYLNVEGALETMPAWTTPDGFQANSLAWADVDADGDLDLALGNEEFPSVIYKNNIFPLSTTQSWARARLTTPPESELGRQSMSIGDWSRTDYTGAVFGTYGNTTTSGRVIAHDSTLNWGGFMVCIRSRRDDVSYPSRVTSVALGDVDGDGRLDIAVGKYGQPSAVYLQQDYSGGQYFNETPVWTSPPVGQYAQAIAVSWGDVDGDGDLDLVIAGDFTPQVQLFLNVNGTLQTTPAWTVTDYGVSSLAWGDMDNDGDLDLAIGNNNRTSMVVLGNNKVYLNVKGMLQTTPVWTAAEKHITNSVAWGDVDGDGDLDLAVGNSLDENWGTSLFSSEPVQIYMNVNGRLQTTPSWEAAEDYYTRSLAWGDADGDGDLDLAVGNMTAFGTNGYNQVYLNDDGVLQTTPAWTASETRNNNAIGWAHVNIDGRLDLLTANVDLDSAYYNIGAFSLPPYGVDQRMGITVSTIGNAAPTFKAGKTATSLAPAQGYALSWVREGVIPIKFTLFAPNHNVKMNVRAEYSLNGGDHWQTAVAASGTITTGLATNLLADLTGTPTVHTFNWDILGSGFFGQSDNVVVRLIAWPYMENTSSKTPGPFQQAYVSTTTFPFRVRGSQVRVMNGANPAPNALVYRFQPGQKSVSPSSALDGTPYRTNTAGYLAGRGELKQGDLLVAIQPMITTTNYTVYATNAPITLNGMVPYTVTAGGVQTLTVSLNNPLVLYNLDVSLEWDVRYDPVYSETLKYNFQRASEILYDWTNGQAALGNITIYHNREHWNDAEIRIHASNDLRPSALKGGITEGVITDTQVISITYSAGQVHMGAVWNRYGEGGSNLSDDWPRTLAHELGHYLLYLDDNYLGYNATGQVVPVSSCPSAMSDPYRQDFPYDELHPDANWSSECGSTLSQAAVGRSDWATARAFYPFMKAPGIENEGPAALPLLVTQVQYVDPAGTSQGLADPTFYLSLGGGRVQPGSSARAVLYQDGWAIDVGQVVIDHVLFRGAKPGDQVCVYEPEAYRQGCETVAAGDEQLAMVSTPGWNPEITVTPITSVTLQISVTQTAPGLNLQARLYPSTSATPVGGTISLVESGGIYTGKFSLTEPAFVGFVQIWDAASGLQAVTDYSVGGNPTFARGSGTFARGSGTFARGSGAPVMSADGQVILFVDDRLLGPEQYYILQPLVTVPSPLGWARPVGTAYRLAASANAPTLTNASLQITYMASQAEKAEERWLSLYYWDGAAWTMLKSVVDEYQNSVSAMVPGPGVYALMSSFAVPLYSAGWNLVSYPLQNSQSVTEALASISGTYKIVYGYLATDAADPWKVFLPEIPPEVNDLKKLEYGHGYWISATQAITWYVGGPNGSGFGLDQVDQTLISAPPATVYGTLGNDPDGSPQAGLRLTAWIDGVLCGQTHSFAANGQIWYVLDVEAGCDASGSAMTIKLEDRVAASDIPWNNNLPLRLDIGWAVQVFLPLVTP